MIDICERINRHFFFRCRMRKANDYKIKFQIHY